MTVATSELARKYARAFLNYVQQEITEDQIEKLDQAVTAWRADQKRFFYLSLTSMSAAIKEHLVLQGLEEWGVHKVLAPLVHLLALHGRLVLLLDVMQHLVIEWRSRAGIIDVRVLSSDDLSVEQLRIVENFAERVTQKRIRLMAAREKKLIVGLRLQMETLLWECSLAQRLRRWCR